MYNMSDEDKKKYKLEKTASMREYNSEVIQSLGISPYDFNMKSQFLDDYKRLVVGVFPSEFKRPKGFYFELIDSDLNPIDPDRKIYKIPYTESFDGEYELNAKGSYLVPIEDLKVVHRSSILISKEGAFSEPTGGFKVTAKAQQELNNISKVPTLTEDAPYSEMTIRDYFAIKVNKPVSNKNWLNELIKNNK